MVNGRDSVIGKTLGNTEGRSIVPIVVVVLAISGVVVAVLAKHNSSSPTAPGAPATIQSEAAQAPASQLADDGMPLQLNQEISAPSGRSAVLVKRSAQTVIVPASAPPSAPPRPAPTAYTRQLVTGLADLQSAKVPHSAEEATAWKQNLQQLVQQGAAAVPAIQEFLDKNADLGFGREGSQLLGYASARYAMFDALRQIGGPEGVSAMAGVLQNTADPGEISRLAQYLEQVAPGEHAQEALEAARQTLAMAADGKLSQTDVSPLFDVIAKYGGPIASAELEQTAGSWKYYSAIALAQMPDGAGIPSLVKMVQDNPNGGPLRNVAALEMLAQAAAQNQDARNALVDLARANSIAPKTWAYLAPMLAGDQIQFSDSSSLAAARAGADTSDIRTYHISAGNQNFYSAPVQGMTTDQINQQLGLIDSMLAATSDPTATQTLQTARAQLQRRLSQATAAPPGPGH